MSSDYFGPALGLPPAISGHDSYWLWGPRDCTGEVVLTVGMSRDDLAGHFGSVEEGGVFRCVDCMPFEDGNPICVARGLNVPIDEAWEAARRFE